MKQRISEPPLSGSLPKQASWWKDSFVVGFGILFGTALWVSCTISSEWLPNVFYTLGIAIAAAVVLFLSRGYQPPPVKIAHPFLECWVSIGWYGIFFLLSMLWKGEGILADEFGKWVWFIVIPITLLLIVRGRKIDLGATLQSIGLHRHGLGKAVLFAILAYALMVPAIAMFMPNPQLQKLQAILHAPLKALIILPLSIGLSFITAATTEEIFFRGIIQSRLAEVSGSEIRGCLLAAFLFGIYHLPYAYFLADWPTHGNMIWALSAVLTEQMAAGVLLGILWVRTHNLFAPIVFHTLVNTLAIMTMLK